MKLKHCEDEMSREEKKVLLVGFIFVAGIVLLNVVTGKLRCNPKPEETRHEPTASTPDVSSRQSAPSIGFTIIEDDVYDTPLKTQIMKRVVLKQTATRLQILALLDSIFSAEERRTGFKYNTHPTHIYVYLYYSMRDYKVSGGNWIAMKEKSDNSTPFTTEDNEKMKMLRK